MCSPIYTINECICFFFTGKPTAMRGEYVFFLVRSCCCWVVWRVRPRPNSVPKRTGCGVGCYTPARRAPMPRRNRVLRDSSQRRRVCRQSVVVLVRQSALQLPFIRSAAPKCFGRAAPRGASSYRAIYVWLWTLSQPANHCQVQVRHRARRDAVVYNRCRHWRVVVCEPRPLNRL